VAESAIPGLISIVETSGQGGRCVAANAGIKASDAEFVVLHDDDDLWHPEFLARTTGLLSATDHDAGVMVTTEIVYEERHGEGWKEYARAPFWAGLSDVTFTSLLEVNRAVPISFLYRRALHEELGYYDEDLETVEDWEFYLRVAASHPIAFLGGTALAFWTQRPSVRGVDGNSMFELEDLHGRDDLAVRDKALRDWVRNNGAGLPLYLALLERRRREELSELLDAQRERLVAELYDRHPLWRRVRKLTRRPR
jgi:glycosyltransferase involved in cell wall biosynthesis